MVSIVLIHINFTTPYNIQTSIQAIYSNRQTILVLLDLQPTCGNAMSQMMKNLHAKQNPFSSFHEIPRPPTRIWSYEPEQRNMIISSYHKYVALPTIFLLIFCFNSLLSLLLCYGNYFMHLTSSRALDHYGCCVIWHASLTCVALNNWFFF